MPSPQSALYLIDGYALIYRAFFAMINRPLRTSRGENTSAVWGVANFLHRLFERHRPAYVAWVHDSGSSFRDEVYPEYKATREKLDAELQEDFDRSVDRIEALLEAFRVPLVEVEGYEADDVIGTLASAAAGEGVHVVIVSGDKDFYQLISARVGLLNPGRGGPAAVEERFVDPSNAEERLGVPPERVVDYLALVGDASDNVPGVRGIGDKTARKLIEQFGDLDNILAHAAEVTAKRARTALMEEADAARLSRQLTTIRRDVPVDLDLERWGAKAPDAEVLRQLYSELEFHSLLAKLGEPPKQEADVATEIVRSPGELGAVVEPIRAAGAVAIEPVVEGAVPRLQLVGLALAADGRAWYLPLAHVRPQGELLDAGPPPSLPALDGPQMRPLADLLGDPAVEKSVHDAKSARLALGAAGVELAGIAFDSMLASFLVDPGRRSHALEVLASDHLGLALPTAGGLLGKGKDAASLRELAPEAVAEMAGGRSAAIARWRRYVAPQLAAAGAQRLLDEIELPLSAVLGDMEAEGIAVDVNRLRELAGRFGDELATLEEAIYREAGTTFNVNSTPQLQHILFEKLRLPVVKKTKTGPSTSAEVLDELAGAGFALPSLLLEYRELAKLKSTYVDVLPQRVDPTTGRIHTTFNQVGAATGRLSSSDPNLQNIPVRTRRGELIRECFVPAPGHLLLTADYSQIELRLLAHLSGDPLFIDAFRRGEDVHRETAAAIFDVPVAEVTSEQRARAKTINFATIYGQGAFALSRQLGIGQEEARDFIRRYFERVAGVREYLDRTVERARTDGFVETLFGRRRYVPELQDKNYNTRAFGERVAMNSPLQGSAADLIKIAMIDLHDRLKSAKLGSRILLQVHDELVLEVPEEEQETVREPVRRAMVEVAELRVPLVVDVGVGRNWLEAKA